ncbi:MAG: class I SAM-dependent methyltransferase [Fibrobacteria bacterium]|nr:class I SAM-dependent methyltransferase [Fibrobacteria bacterium]
MENQAHPSPSVQDAPYAVLADRYDRVMDHVDYEGWASLVQRIWRLHGIRPTRILETGAGTCRMAGLLARAGRRIVATDLSPRMLACGGGRTQERIACDYRALPFAAQSFDAILCLYDAINYCLTSEDLLRFFREARRVLRSGGLLLADATTVRNSRLHFLDAHFHETHGETEIIRHSWYEPHRRLQHNEFRFFLPCGEGKWSRRMEHHVQKVWTPSELRLATERAGFAPPSLHDDSLGLAGPSALRLHLVARAP